MRSKHILIALFICSSIFTTSNAAEHHAEDKQPISVLVAAFKHALHANLGQKDIPRLTIGSFPLGIKPYKLKVQFFTDRVHSIVPHFNDRMPPSIIKKKLEAGDIEPTLNQILDFLTAYKGTLVFIHDTKFEEPRWKFDIILRNDSAGNFVEVKDYKDYDKKDKTFTTLTLVLVPIPTGTAPKSPRESVKRPLLDATSTSSGPKH